MLIFFTRRTHDPELALDLLSETFVVAFDDRLKFRGRTIEEATGWVWAIARRRLADYWRQGDIERRALSRAGVICPRSLTDDEYERIEQLAELEPLRRRVREELDALPADQAEALQLRVIEERPYGDISDRLGVPEQTVRARVSRGLRAIHESLGDAYLR
jgi:RNA polymerase sigma-70 factor (ECF subfamily)